MSQQHARVFEEPVTPVLESSPRASIRPLPVRIAPGDGHPRMRLVVGGRKPVVELTSSLPENRLYEAYRALRARGVQVIHTAVRRSGDKIVQLLHLAEADGSDFTSRRLRETMATLRRDCGVLLMHPRRGAVQSWLEPQSAASRGSGGRPGGAAWQQFAT